MSMKKDDLLSKLGAKSSSEGAVKTEPSQSSARADSRAQVTETGPALGRGSDMLKAAAIKSESPANDSQATTDGSDVAVINSKVEPSVSVSNSSGNSSTETDNWTLDNALKEIKKLREENKATRIKYSEAVDNLKKESDTRITAKEQELHDLIQAKTELEELKAKEEDRKRDLSEKLAHRESLLGEFKAKLETERRAYQEELQKMEATVQQYRAEQEAQMEVHKQRLETELAAVPEKYKDIATYIVKGAGDPRDALVALNEAKLKGLFEDKKVVVSHSVPGAADGARASKEKLDAAVGAAREKMNSSDKIREGLKQIRSGETNTAFRIR